ncbi:hypothetical protein, partial [uncultured Paenibacillus sp.]|uniref:hypothetical protein n=1 Tax=uncultured Paenibacillus sp. TaxID=227322 RepID=UPI002593B96E
RTLAFQANSVGSIPITRLYIEKERDGTHRLFLFFCIHRHIDHDCIQRPRIIWLNIMYQHVSHPHDIFPSLLSLSLVIVEVFK